MSESAKFTENISNPALAGRVPTVPRRKALTARAGILGVGHHTYWGQFDGLLSEMQRKLGESEKRVSECGVQVFNYGMVDQAQSAYQVLPRIQEDHLDLLFVDMVTYATSSTFGVLIRSLDIPVVLLALQPSEAMDYKNGTTFMQLCHDDFCSVPEFTGVAIRMGKKPPPVILGHRQGDAGAEAEIRRWCRIAMVLHDLKSARIGLMGHVLESMLDMHVDPTAVTAAFGAHVVLTEPDELLEIFLKTNPEAVEAKKRDILAFFHTPDPKSDPITEKLTEADLEQAARCAVALDKFIEVRNLDGLAYYYEGRKGSDLRALMTNLIVGNSLLTSAGFPMCGEFDLKTCLAMMIMDRLDIGGSFAEFHPVDFKQDTVLVGHDGPHHINIANERPVLRSLKKFHGKPGSGASVEFKLKTGPITMLSIGINAQGKFKFVMAEGESMDRPIPPTGNTNTHGKFKPDVRTFLRHWVHEGPTHHFALGIGHHARELASIADILNIESVVVGRSIGD